MSGTQTEHDSMCDVDSRVLSSRTIVAQETTASHTQPQIDRQTSAKGTAQEFQLMLNQAGYQDNA